MFTNILFEYDLESMKNEHMMESATDSFNIAVMELTMLKNQGFVEESESMVYAEAVGKYTEAIKKFFQNLIESIKKLVKEVQEKVRLEMTKRDVNKKLKELKKAMAADKTAYSGKMVKIFDMKKYMKEYTKYINFYVTSVKSLYSKEYSNYDEFLKALKNAEDALTKMADNCHLDDFGKWELETGVNNAITLTETELNSMESVQRAFYNAWIEAIEKSEEIAEKEDDSSKISKIKSMTSKFSSMCSRAYTKMMKHPVESCMAIFAVCGAILGAKSKSFDHSAGAKVANATYGATVGTAVGGVVGAGIVHDRKTRERRMVDTISKADAKIAKEQIKTQQKIDEIEKKKKANEEALEKLRKYM